MEREPLHPIVKSLCDYYTYEGGKFITTYDEASSKWIVTFSENWDFLHNDLEFRKFYWSSDNSVENFLEQIKDFFFSIGHDAGKYY